MNQAFAAALCDWTQSGAVATEMLCIEDVLDHVVHPVVRDGNRVLLIVLDGMSWEDCWTTSKMEQRKKPRDPVRHAPMAVD
jgi:hypothetical protein